MQTKRCTMCGVVKTLDNYYMLETGKFGVHSKCKECMKALQKSRAFSSDKLAVKKALDEARFITKKVRLSALVNSSVSI